MSFIPSAHKLYNDRLFRVQYSCRNPTNQVHTSYIIILHSRSNNKTKPKSIIPKRARYTTKAGSKEEEEGIRRKLQFVFLFALFLGGGFFFPYTRFGTKPSQVPKFSGWIVDHSYYILEGSLLFRKSSIIYIKKGLVQKKKQSLLLCI